MAEQQRAQNSAGRAVEGPDYEHDHIPWERLQALSVEKRMPIDKLARLWQACSQMSTSASDFNPADYMHQLCQDHGFSRAKVSNLSSQHAATSEVFVSDDGTVVKHVKATPLFQGYELVQREVCALRLLQQFSWCPRLLASTPTTITTSFAGEQVTAANIPADYAAQTSQILKDVASVGVKHNDIVWPRGPDKPFAKIEVLVLNGRLSLIDFGWATFGRGQGTVPCGVSEKLSPEVPHGWTPGDDAALLGVLHGIWKTHRLLRTWEMHVFIQMCQNPT